MSKPKNVRRIMDEALIREEKTFHARRTMEALSFIHARWRPSGVDVATDRLVELIEFAAHLLPVSRVAL